MATAVSSKKENSFSKKEGTASANKKVADRQAIEGNPLPSNQDAEQGLLAACIMDASGEVIGRCIEQSFGSDHFYHFKHQLIFEALLDLHRENKEADEILLAEKLSSRGQLDQVGGQEGLIELTSRIDTTGHASFWLDIVKQKALLRRCIYVAFDIIDGAESVFIER
jgi:replicative DNA helicase